jgi:light-harvesting complex I chlorophyll a/b binding protein 1
MARFNTLLALCLAAGASAFTTPSNKASSTTLNAKPVNQEIGVQAPVGFFDPLGLLKSGPYGGVEENFQHYRAVEVKHGRIAMAATLGMLVQQTTRFEGYLSPSANLKFEDVPNGLKALDAVPLEGWVQMAVVIGMHEVFIKQREGRVPGDFGTGYFGFTLDDQSSKQLRGLSVEITNGRLAMLGILGMFASEIVHNGEVLAETKIFG